MQLMIWLLICYGMTVTMTESKIGAVPRGLIDINGCTVKLGCDPDLHEDYQENITGALVVWEGGGASGVTTKEVMVKNCHFEVGEFFPGKNAAKRTNVNIAFTDKFTMMNTTIKQWPDTAPALSFGSDVPEIILERTCVVIGDVKIDGITYHDYDFDGTGWADFIAAVDTAVIPPNHPRVTLI